MSSTNNSSNRMVVPEAKEALDILPERQRRRLYGEEDDRGTGEEDGGQIKAAWI